MGTDSPQATRTVTPMARPSRTIPHLRLNAGSEPSFTNPRSGVSGQRLGGRNYALATQGTTAALQRRGRDSNPRGTWTAPSGFQDRRIRPLCHPSGRARDDPTAAGTLAAEPRRGGRVAEGTRLLSEYGVHAPSRVRIPPSPLPTKLAWLRGIWLLARHQQMRVV